MNRNIRDWNVMNDRSDTSEETNGRYSAFIGRTICFESTHCDLSLLFDEVTFVEVKEIWGDGFESRMKM